METRTRSWIRQGLPFVALAALTLAAYSNHFDNSFQFDDFHSVVNNARVHSLSNWKDFFRDPAAFSVLPTNQVFRPVLSLSLALDWTAGGGSTRWFHVSTFVWFLVLAACLRMLFFRFLQSYWWSWFATALFVLHPVSAETVNYIIQRGDLYATLGIAASLALYIGFPAQRKWGWYLIPYALGVLSKPPALIYPLLLVAYILLYEERRWKQVLLRVLPALVTTAALGLWSVRMTASSYAPGASDAGLYRATQGYVTWHYFRSFFLPLDLSADTDMTVAQSYFDLRVLLGLAFVALLAAAAWYAVRRLPAASFGLIWFLAALVPTALMALAEVANDHRMFMAFPGLTLAVCAVAQKVLAPRLAASRAWRVSAAVAGSACILAAGAGTYQRNEVWRSEETLWRDVTIKSPGNGRGLMNYGLTLMQRGDYGGALEYFDRATEFVPFYPLLQINRAIALAALGRNAQAEANFRNAIQLNPRQSTGYYQYGKWLWQTGRRDEAAQNLEAAVRLNPQDFQAAALRMEVLASLQQWRELQDLVENTLRLAPAEPSALRYRRLLPAAPTGPPRTAEQFLDLSLAHYRAGRYRESVGAAKKALELRPDYAEAYNNIAAGYNAQHMWDEGIRAASEAVRLRPDWDLARNNLLHAQRSKAEGK